MTDAKNVFNRIQAAVRDPQVLESLSDTDKRALMEWLESAKYNWELMARPSQRVPKGSWNTWIINAGRGFGKTRIGSEAVRYHVQTQGYRAIGLIAPTAADARDTMIDGKGGSSLLEISPQSEGLIYYPTKRKLVWKNGAVGNSYSAEEPERMRGPQHDLLWCLTGDSMVIMGDYSEKPLRDVIPGDFVMTRNGPREVLVSASRKSDLVRVNFENGSSLMGSFEHPILTLDGWKPLGRLTKYDRIYSWKRTGKETHKGTTRRTKTEKNFIGTDGSTSSITGQSQMVITFITSTMSRAMIGLKTLWQLAQRGTKTTTQSSFLMSNAQFAVENSNQQNMENTAKNVGLKGMKAHVSAESQTANIVGRNLRPEEEIIAVSGVSTLGRDGLVFNLKVDGDSEFFANGILTHNCDEFASWGNLEATYDMALFGLRLGKNPRNIITTTPKPLAILKQLLKDATPASEMKDGMHSDVVFTTGATMENADNLAPQFLETLKKKYEGTRLGRQEIYAEILDDNPNALFRQDNIDSNRVEWVAGTIRRGSRVQFRYIRPQGAERPQTFWSVLKELVIAVDPALSNEVSSDETGMLVMACDEQNSLFVLEDSSGIMSPNEWGVRALRLYQKYDAEAIVAEVNQGGDLVEHVIRTAEKEMGIGRVTYKKVRASKGKFSRAEPVGALEEQGRIHHVGEMPKLEDQLVTFQPGYQVSPDRLDAYVWGAHHLIIQKEKKGFFIF
jgi:phage terminase large subunit-like protein